MGFDCSSLALGKMGSNGVDHPLKDLVEESVSSQEQSKDFQHACGIYYKSLEMDNIISLQMNNLDAGSFREQRNQKTNSSRHTSVLEIFQSKEINVGSSPQRG